MSSCDDEIAAFDPDSSASCVVAYPSHSILNLATFDTNHIPSVQTTLRTATIPNPNLDPAAGDRIITAISAVEIYTCNDDGDDAKHQHQDQHVLACAFSDGTVTVWHKLGQMRAASDGNDDNNDDEGGNGWAEEIIVGHTPTRLVAKEEKKADTNESNTSTTAAASPTSVADVAGCFAFERPLLVATASVDGINLHLRSLLSSSEASTTTATTATMKISSHPAASISIKVLPRQNELLIVTGTASPRGNKVHVYTLPLSSISSLLMQKEPGAAILVPVVRSMQLQLKRRYRCGIMDHCLDISIG